MRDDLDPSSGFAGLIGYRLVAWREDHAEVELTLEPKHLNRNGVPHGGVLATLIDTACGYCGVHCTVPGNRRAAVTLSLSTQFIGQAAPGMRLRALAERVGGGRHIFFARCEVRDEAGRLVAQGDGTFRYRSGSEDPAGQPA